MEITALADDNVTVVAVSGAVNASTAPHLREYLNGLLSSARPNFVIDLGDVPFLDSSGLGVLVGLFKRVRIGEGDVRLCGLQSPIARVFEITRLNQVFDIFADRESAVSSFHPE